MEQRYGNLWLELFDAQGRRIASSVNPKEIDLTGQPDGIYYAVFRNGKGQTTTLKLQKCG
ncbi:MAG: T9SS type A sorting domain-containing protein [Bacteroidetes bacterium]|nr:T9SS type A sorting domain-containing protein [Bacteroidota bacterium]